MEYNFFGARGFKLKFRAFKGSFYYLEVCLDFVIVHKQLIFSFSTGSDITLQEEVLSFERKEWLSTHIDRRASTVDIAMLPIRRH